MGRRRRAMWANTAKAYLRGAAVYALARRLRQRYERRRYVFEVVYMDVNNVCNLRCPFCYNDWGTTGKPRLMSAETFAKALQLMPVVPDGLFHLSCSFEPTLNPQFITLLETIPRGLRRSGFFTTNLTTKLSDDFLARLARCNLHHINVSVESFVPEVYERCRANGRFERFVENLERLTAAFAQAPDPPPVYFITVATTLNADSVPETVRLCASRYAAAYHEVRSVGVSSANEDWARDHSLDAAGWRALEEGLRRAGCTNYTLVERPTDEGAYYSRQGPRSRFMIIDADGTARVGDNREFRVENTFDLNRIADPPSYFRAYWDARRERERRPAGPA